MIFRRDAATSIQGAAGPDSIRTQADAVWMSRRPTFRWRRRSADLDWSFNCDGDVAGGCVPSLQTTPPQHARGKSHGLRSRDGSFLRQLRQRARPSVFVAEDGYRPNITRQPFRVNRRNEAICWLVVSQYLLTVITFTLLTLYKCDTFIEEYNLMFATWHYSALLCASLCWGVARHGRHLKCWGLLASQYNINIYSIHFWHYTTVTLFLRISLDVSIMHCHFTLFKIAVCNWCSVVARRGRDMTPGGHLFLGTMVTTPQNGHLNILCTVFHTIQYSYCCYNTGFGTINQTDEHF